MFSLGTSKVVFKNKEIKNEEIIEVKVKVPVQKETRYIIYLELGISNKVLLKVYDKIEMRYVYYVQCPLASGHKQLEYAKRTYRSYTLINKLENSELLFEL